MKLKKYLVFGIVFSMIIVSTSSAYATLLKKETYEDENIINVSASNADTFEKTKTTVEKFKIMEKSDFQPYNELSDKKISIPWTNSYSGDILDWYIRLVYNGEEFFHEVPITINDFQEKFLKHPEYGEILKFNVDSDPEDDVEVIIGFYWSIIKKADGSEVKSLETRFRVRQLPHGDVPGIGDINAEFEVWSELHVNWGLVKESARSRSNEFANLFENLFSNIFKNRFRFIERFLDTLIGFKKNSQNTLEVNDVSDDDYFSIGAGYRSPAGVEIPRYTEKRFAFAKDRLFSPSIFQHKMDPGNAKGEDPFELLYGFRSYEAATSNLKYDIEFSVEFEPAVYLITKFVPLGGYVYYYFDQDSQTYSDTKVTFSTNILEGSGDDVTLSLVFDKIDDTLGRSGRWMMFDIDLIDFEPLGGSFHYEASNKFNVGVIVNAPGFSEKVKIKGIPTRADFSWDLDVSIIPGQILKTDVSGFVDCSMSSDIDEIIVYFPKTEPDEEDVVFLDVKGIPSVKVGGDLKLHIDLNNFANTNNYVYGRIYQSSSSSLDDVKVFLPEFEDPIFEINSIPAHVDVSAGLYWNQLRGFASGYTSSGADMTVQIEYGNFKIIDTLGLSSGSMRTDFKIANSGYIGLDTSREMISNDLYFTNTDTGDEISLSIGSLDANGFNIDWELGADGSIEDIKFRGILSILRGLELDLKYKGRNTDLNLGWVLGEEGYFDIALSQENDLAIDFSELFPSGENYVLDGELVLSQNIKFDMSWQFKQGSSLNDPGKFVINQYTSSPNLKHFHLYFTYQNNYGIEIEFFDLQVYLNLKWWKGDRILPYVWLDYEVSVNDLDVDLLWDGEWHHNVEDWG